MRWLAAAILLLATASVSHAQVVLSLDTTRGGLGSFAQGETFNDARSALTTDYPGVSYRSVSQLTAADFTGVDLAILSPVFSNEGAISPLSLSEQEALAAYVASGGNLLLLMDSSEYFSSGLIEPFGFQITGNVQPPISCTPLAPGHPVFDGPAGVVSSFSQSGASYFTSFPFESVALATNGMGPALLERGRSAFEPMAGRMLVFTDSDTFASDGSLDGADFGSNQVLWKNSVAYLLPSGSVGTTQASWGELKASPSHD